MKYTPTNEWSTEAIITNWAEWESCSLIDERGREYQDGCHRVRVLQPIEKFKTKTFKGETAWSDAQRLFGDIQFAIQRKNW